jgi:nucleotide-binding universal stress UspA family protein
MADPALAAGWTQELERRINESLEHALELVDDRVPATTARTEGEAGLRLAEFGREAAFILMGSSGHGPVLRAVVGSTSRTVLHHAKAPVIVMCKRGD